MIMKHIAQTNLFSGISVSQFDLFNCRTGFPQVLSLLIYSCGFEDIKNTEMHLGK